MQENKKLDFNYEQKLQERIIDGYFKKIDELIIEGLKRKGYIFESREERRDFLKRHGESFNSIDIKSTTYFIKKEPFLEIYNEEIDFNFEDFKISAITKYRYL